MAKSKKIIGFTAPSGFTGTVNIPTSINDTLVKQISADIFKDKGVTKIIANTYSDDAISGAPWGASNASIEYRDKTIEPPKTKLPVGGRIFYVHNDNGATYKFWDAQNNELTTQTVAGLEML